MHQKPKNLLSRMLIPLLLMFIPISALAGQAPDFSLSGNDQQTIKLSDYRGKVVYLDFWASWCVPCRKSFPWMNEMKKRHSKKGLEIIAINLDSKPEKAAFFLEKIPANFTIAFDPEGKTAKSYEVKGMPSSYFIDRKGVLRDSHIGFRSKDEAPMEQRLIELLNEK